MVKFCVVHVQEFLFKKIQLLFAEVQFYVLELYWSFEDASIIDQDRKTQQLRESTQIAEIAFATSIKLRENGDPIRV